MPNIIETTDAAGNTSTAYILAVGQTAQGQIGAIGDHDWYAVNLVAGQTYTFAMTGTGTNNVQDTFLNLFAANGTTLVASNDDGLQGSNSVFTYTAATTGVYYIDAGAFNNAGTGQYGVSVTAGTLASFDLQMSAGVMDTDLSWSVTPGTGATVTWGFALTSHGGEPTFSQLSAAEMAAVQTVLAMFSEMSGLTFTQVNPGGFTDNATMLFANYSSTTDGAGAYAYYPGSTASNSVAGDVWLNTTSVSTSSLPFGSYSFYVLIHEIGHALGLSHPGLYNAAPGVNITYANDAQFIQDTNQYTVMSYFDEVNTTGTGWGSYPDTLMMADIYAMQQIYGANMTTHAGDSIYGFGSNVGSIYNFAINTNPALCIWDGGGTDKLDCSGYSQNQIINLNAGTFSNIGGLIGNVSIALGALIENATGGSGNDTITGNDVANVLDGGGGADTLIGGAGNDTLFGGTGNDIMRGGTGDDFYFVDSLGDSVIENAGEGINDWVYASVSGYTLTANVENGQLLINTGATMFGNSLNNVLVGGNGNDTLYGLDGNDSFNGGLGVDTTVGGIGDDSYLIDNVGDVVVENSGEGTDWVIVSVSGYTLAPNVEHGHVGTTAGTTLTGNSGFGNTLIGNIGNDTLYGLDGNDALFGGAGADTMLGGTGTDYCFVDNLGDTIIENAGEGVSDWAYVSVSGYTLAAEVENAQINSATGMTLTGNALANVLLGGSGTGIDTLFGLDGNDSIDGKAGADIMVGGIGNDTYVVDNVGDTIIENAGEGAEWVIVNVSGYTLAPNVENALIGVTTGVTLTGNSAANVLISGAGNDTLIGGGGTDNLQGGVGNDILDGGIGTDTLIGGANNDTFVFHSGEGNGDIVTDFVGNGAAVGDQLQFVGYGTAGAGATFIQIDATHWQINSADGLVHEILTFSNAATFHATDYLFV